MPHADELEEDELKIFQFSSFATFCIFGSMRELASQGINPLTASTELIYLTAIDWTSRDSKLRRTLLLMEEPLHVCIPGVQEDLRLQFEVTGISCEDLTALIDNVLSTWGLRF